MPDQSSPPARDGVSIPPIAPIRISDPTAVVPTPEVTAEDAELATDSTLEKTESPPSSPAEVSSETPEEAQAALNAIAADITGQPVSTPAPTPAPLPTSVAAETVPSAAPAVGLESDPPPAPNDTPVDTTTAAASAPAGGTPTLVSNNTLLNVLLRENAISQQHADQLLIEQIRSGKTIEDLLTEKQLVNEEDLSKAKAEVFGVPFVKVTDIGISPEALTILPESVARRYGMLPFAVDNDQRTLSVAMINPLDLAAIDFAEQKTGYRLIIHYAMPSELERVIAERYAQSLSSEVTQALAETSQVAEQRQKELDLSQLGGEVVRQAPITKIVETILSFALKARASDIHIEPLPERTRIRYRIDGILTEKLILPKSVHDATISRIKILSDLKIDEKRVPQDGRFTFMSGNDEVDLRISTLPTIHGEKVVMRLLRKDTRTPTLSELGLRGVALSAVEDAIRVPHGIILVTGPTGSGKTTTLYSVLHKLNTPKVNIMTLEDPVEYQMEGINQVQINPQAGLTFASGLRSFLRQDPNIIMVGEVRDSETAELAIQASLTGHLVFSTLHTSSAAGALPRLLDMGAEPFLLASSMTLTMGQRVVRLINPEYKEEYQPDPALIADIKEVLGEQFDRWCKQNQKDPETITLFRAKKDRPQTEPEYKGRIAIFEVMRITDEIGSMILERKSATDLEKIAIKDGMLLMKQDGYLKALEGLTTIEEVLRVAQV